MVKKRCYYKAEWLIGITFLVMLCLVLMFRNRFSFSWSDESFYMAEVHRLFLGERPIVDEWNPAQFFSVLLLPLYQIYVKCNGNTDGIYLWARNLYIVMSFFSAFLTYYVFKTKMRIRNVFCVMAGALVMIYSRANVCGPSYHNLFFAFYLSSFMLLLYIVEALKEGKLRLRYKLYGSFAGMLLGMAIISIPLLLFPLGIVWCILLFVLKRDNYVSYLPLFIWTSGGIFLVGAAYFLFIFSQITFIQLKENIQYLFINKEHEVQVFYTYIKSFGQLVWGYGKYMLIQIFICCIVKICVALIKFEGNKWIEKILYILSAVVFLYNLYYHSSSHMSSYLIFGLYGVLLLLLMMNNAEYKILLGGGIIIWFCISALVVIITFSLASATSDPMIEGFVILSLFAIILLSKKEVGWGKRWEGIRRSLNLCVVLAMFGMTFYVRINSVYRDAPLQLMDTRITEGPAKGLITTKEHAKQYSDCLEVMQYINEMEDNENNCTIWISALAPWMYVCTSIHNGAPSPWIHTLEDPLVALYYETHDMEKLKYILVLEKEYGGFQVAGNVEGTNLNPNENKNQGEIWEKILKDYDVIKFECGDLYIHKKV